MDEVIRQAVERVITTMRENLGEPLTIDDMARAAMFSKFHFSRIFQRVTGVSPGKFLAALRLQKAKQLLVTTSLNVADISLRVGYTSVGTFSSRFSRSVGLSPTMYRRLGGFTPRIAVDHGHDPAAASGSVRGHIRPATVEPQGPVFVGLFPDRIPQGRPVGCAILAAPGPYTLDKVPEGRWYVLAHSVGTEDEGRHPFAGGQTPSVGTHGPITVHRDTIVMPVDVRLQPMRPHDPPVLLALLDARKLRLEIPAS